MSKARFTRANASFVGIRKSGSCSIEPDTDKHEKDSTHAIDLEVLKAIRRTVLAIRTRIDAGGSFGSNLQPSANGNSSSSKTPSPNSGKDPYTGETQER
jgi:hypothetical protein